MNIKYNHYYNIIWICAITIPVVINIIKKISKEEIPETKKEIPETKEEINNHSKLKEFDLERLKTGDNIFIVGRRNSGKSTLISKIINYFKDIPVELVISPTEILERFYIKGKKYINHIHHEYKTELIGKMIKKQKDNINSHIIEDNERFIVLDNCLLLSEFNDKNLTDLLINGFFYKTINIIAAAYPIGFGKYFKTSIDYLFIFRDTHVLYIKLIYDEYFKELMGYKEFIYLFNKYTNNYNCIVIDFKDNGKLYYF